MAFDPQGIRFLLHARKRGVAFGEVATLGRQTLLASRAELAALALEFPVHEPAQREAVLAAAGGFAEPLLQLLGARSVASFDVSDFEGATVRHDFNLPLPKGHDARFDTVIDAGSLEHVFQFPVAMTNLMQLVKLGGHLLLITPTNHFSGHGFYQFSPELFYRVLGPENGFQVVTMLATELFPDAFWYAVPDPAEVRGRVIINSCCETYLCVLAQRAQVRPLFASLPQQSDYSALWQSGGAGGPAVPPAAQVANGLSAKLHRHAKHRLLKYLRFGGRDREMMMRSPVFRRVQIP
ncbi:MAG: hypothetical protein FJ406_09250 [Verrucomicrobia bacterium]|nr:hypothetical protein [Verrucomicrobiota bacterium]